MGVNEWQVLDNGNGSNHVLHMLSVPGFKICMIDNHFVQLIQNIENHRKKTILEANQTVIKVYLQGNNDKNKQTLFFYISNLSIYLFGHYNACFHESSCRFSNFRKATLDAKFHTRTEQSSAHVANNLPVGSKDIP